MKLNDLLLSAGYQTEEWMTAIEISGIASDSRRVKKGELFVAIRGLQSDGYVHIGEALSRGAAFVVAERRVAGVASIVVKNARIALARLFDAWYGHPAASMFLIGITGTNGKTSTLSMLEAIFAKAGLSCGVIGTVAARCNGEVLVAKNADKLANMTTPDPAELYRLLADMRDRGAAYVMMEVTSHALFFDKVEPLFFKRAVFTNLTPDHLDLHGDMTTYFMEKRKLFSRCEMGVISLFGAYGQSLSDSINAPFLTVGRGNVTNVLANGAEGVSFSLLHEGENIELFLPVPGDFSVENASLAAMTALSLGVDARSVQAALAEFRGVCGRMERVGENDLDISVFLDYAHTPDALEKLLLSVRRFRLPGQRIILLFGCGGDRDRSKRRKMGRIATRLADLSIITSDNPRGEMPAAIIADIVKGIDKEKPHKIIEDRKEAIAYAVSCARRGDILLLVGKGHEEYEIRGRERLFFSEREIVAACMAEKQREAGE